jgi:hypothetical protein
MISLGILLQVRGKGSVEGLERVEDKTSIPVFNLLKYWNNLGFKKP